MGLMRCRRGGATLLLVALASLEALGAGGCSRGSDHVRASGMIEMDEIDVASMVGGRVERLEVGEGDAVRAGQVLAVLEREELAAELSAQAAEAERAAAQAKDVRAGPRAQEIRIARAGVASASADLELAQKELRRAEALAMSQAIAQSDLDRARSRRDAAAARRAAAAESLRLLQIGSRREEVTAAREAAEAAHAQVRVVRSRLRELVLVAPVSGVVLLKNYEPGELAPAGQPVVTLGNPDSLWMRVYVAAPQIERVRLGARAEVRLKGISDHVYTGRVVEVATRAEFTPRAALTEEERANLVFGVKLVLDPSGGALKAGLPADVRIEAPPDRARTKGTTGSTRGSGDG